MPCLGPVLPPSGAGHRAASAFAIALAGLLIWLVASGAAYGQPVAERFLAHDPASMRSVDHRAWEMFLLRYLRIGPDGVHRIAYGRVTADGRQALGRYIAALEREPIGLLNRNEQKAFWLNLYNAAVVRLILDHYPVGSVLDIDAGVGARQGPWGLTVVEVGGVPLSLRDIEQRVLGAIWDDPRVHYALSCGAVGCPNLQPVPFSGRDVDQRLTQAAITYVNDPRCIMIDDQRLVVSSLFRWHRDDFGGSDRDVIRHLMALAEPNLAMALQRFDQISGDMFDWRLNDGSLL